MSAPSLPFEQTEALPAGPLLGRRLRYAWVAGVCLWCAWLLSLALGRDYRDLAGQVVGGDYLQFYSAGLSLAHGASAQLYDMAYQMSLEQRVIAPGLAAYYAFITPPFLAWLYRPLAVLPYGLSFAVWSGLGLAWLWLSLRWLGLRQPARAFAWALTFYPVFASISYGQNSLLSLAILSAAGALWLHRRPWAAGLVAALLLYKPQLLLGLGFLWLLEARRDARPLLGLLAGSALLAGFTAWQMPAAGRAYLDFAARVLPDLPAWQRFPLWNLHTVRGFWRLLLPALPGLADGLAAAAAAACLAAFVAFWRAQRGRPALLFAAAICLTLLLTPHAIIYDWALLVIPAVVLWQERPAQRGHWQTLFAVVWLAALASGPLTAGQLKLMPFAVQISVPALFLACYAAYRRLTPAAAAAPGVNAL